MNNIYKLMLLGLFALPLAACSSGEPQGDAFYTMKNKNGGDRHQFRRAYHFCPCA